MQFRKPAAESSSGPGASFPTNVQRMYAASSQTGRHPLPSARAHEAIPPALTTAPISSNISSAPQLDKFIPPTANQGKKIPESAVPPIPPQSISKAIKLEEVLRSPLKCYISIPSSPLSSPSPSLNTAPAQSVLKTQVQYAAGGMARRQVTFATPSQVFTLSDPPVPSLPTPDSMSSSMSLRDRRAQMTMVSASRCSQRLA
ncbi:hypothetical protein BDR04DRAFT_1098018 [Suillus decipiens]|nr:hypothetical protein BDR04DRAFT_1098018 [Suillus decipiens]